MSAQRSIVIGGGAFAGLALALALRQGLGADIPVIVADPALATRPSRDPRATAIVAACRRLFEAIGVWGEVAADAQPILDMVITDSKLEDATRPVFLTFAGYVEPGEPFAHMVENRHLIDALVARIYSDLGFEQLALVEGWKSVSIDPGNFSAHRFLADAYFDQPRHEIARVSELLQSQLLQPLNLTPLQPQLLDDKLFVLSGAGPGSVGFNEYNRLYASNAVVLRLDGLVGGNSTRGDQAVVAGIRDNVSFSVGQFHYETRGFQPNDAVRKNFYDAFLQATISPQTSLQIEYRNSDVTRQSVLTPFDPDNALPISDRFRNEGVRVGGI